jgi:hypothetical protein
MDLKAEVASMRVVMNTRQKGRSFACHIAGD